MGKTVAELKDIVKVFPGVVALRNMSLQLRAGEIHGLVGENGAGKSTLIKVLTGVHAPDAGTVVVDGAPVCFENPLDAKRRGVSCVYQELNIVRDMSVADNLFLGSPLRRPNSRFLDHAAMRAQTREIMGRMNQDIDPAKKCGLLGMGQQQMVEIGKAVLQRAKLLILDEPTSSLGEQEVRELFAILKQLRDDGLAILYVSHRLEELFELCDVVTVMRDARHIVTAPVRDLDRDAIISHMVGRPLDNLYPKQPAAPGDVALRVDRLGSFGVYKDISFTARRGEILGFAGLIGAGRTELFRGVFGADPVDEGEVAVNGAAVPVRSPKAAIRNGIALLTEDRKAQGLILSQSVNRNIALVTLDKLRKGPFLDSRRMAARSSESVRKLNIKTPSIREPVSQLSGGNQQKVVIGKWTSADMDIYIFDEPTRGIDVGAKVEVYNVMNALVRDGKCVIMISSELPELLGMCDRIIVMRKGRITARVNRGDDRFNQEDIMKAAWGGVIQS
ncbi:MAG: sugar ABC transporter ATP-binding protein [Planctomycetes bacterium]|nr:sugar ABC transporter ATP-binding protein [Planctomycetota bacterium]MCD7896029.1 sugar ABC transporter ATP-binding protein [Planctomycetaceae bacterium]